MKRVVVVGAGLGGLAAACHLAGAGHRVTVVERQSHPGGRAGRLVREGFSFDTGPTVLTMPDLLGEVFHAVGADMADHLRLRPLDPAYRATFADGSTIRVRHGREAMAAEIREQCGHAEEAAFHRFCAWLERLYQLEMPSFIVRNYDHPWDLARPIRPALELLRLRGLGNLARTVRRYFRDERLQRLFSFQSMYAGLAPQEALAIFAVITYMDSVAGVFFPDGGIHSVPLAMAAAAEKGGVEFRYDTTVRQVLHGDAVRGVELADGETIDADAVVVNADLPGGYDLLPKLALPNRLRKAIFSPSALVWHVGVRGLPGKDVAHHNIHFAAGWEKAFRSLLRDGQLMPDPSMLVSVPSTTDPSLAPEGSSTLYVLEPVPNLAAGRVDWSRERGASRDRLAARLDDWGYPSAVVTEELVDPRDWAQEGMAAGSPFSLAHRFFQSGPFRPSNIDKRVRGLVFTGTGTVPGVGVPMVLVSGRLAAERVNAL